MKKILLSFVLLLACVGGWAQNLTCNRGRAMTAAEINALTKETDILIKNICQSDNPNMRYFAGTSNIEDYTNEATWFVIVPTEGGFYLKKKRPSTEEGDGYLQQGQAASEISIGSYESAQVFTAYATDAAGTLTDWATADASDGKYIRFLLGANAKNSEANRINCQAAASKPKYTNYSTTGSWTGHNVYTIEFPLTESVIPSGFYRFKHVSSSKYLAAPEELPTGDTSEQRYSVTLVDNIEENDKHRDVWYIENLGYHTDETKGVMYRVWCFQGGYGLSCFGSPQVFGSFTKGYCPRLYSIVKTTEGNYTLAGHYNDVNSNPLELNNTTGISTPAPVKVTINGNSATFSRTGSATDADSQLEIWPVAPISKSVTIGDIGVGTFAFNSDVQIPEGVEAYVATERGERIGLAKLEGTIPARMGVVLRKTDESKTDFKFEAVHGLGIGMIAVGIGGTPTPVDDKGNLLVGTLAETQLAVDNYILTKKKVDGVATDEVVFGRISKASNIAANKAYLPAEAVSQTRGFYTLMWGDDVETGIEEIQGAVQKDGIFVEGQQIVIVKNGLKYNAKGQRVK